MSHHKLDKVGVVILAAGDGKRMKTGIPKVMNLLKEKPLIECVVNSVEASGVCEKPIVVVNPNHTLVQDYLGDRAVYVIQEKQLGTGHAVATTENTVGKFQSNVVVLYGDMPLLSSETIKSLVNSHITNGNTLTLATVLVPNFEGWLGYFNDFSRIKRDDNGNIIEDIQMKDATADDLKITEVNPSCYCFKTTWLWDNIKTIENKNAQGEFYLTDLIKKAIQQGQKIESIHIDPKEAVGINTKEQLEMASKF